MRKLRILVVEVIALGLLIGWLLWKYPELVDAIVPWLALLIAWHITWEFVLDTRFVRHRAAAFGKRANKVLIWPLIFVMGGGISTLYWLGINKSLARLSLLAAQRDSKKVVIDSNPVEPKAVDPKAVPAPDKSSPTHKVPPPRSALKETPARNPTRLGVGPDAYRDIEDAQVGQWAIEESDKIESLAAATISMYGQTVHSASAQQFFFRNKFKDCCAQDDSTSLCAASAQIGFTPQT